MFGRQGVWVRVAAAVVLMPVVLVEQGWGWGSDGHHMINQLAVSTLPVEVPAFLRTGEGLAAAVYYAPEPDHWRGRAEPELAAASAPEHYMDMEYLDLLGTLPRNRYDYVRAWVPVQAAHPELTLTAEKVGMQPYQTMEVWERLKSAFRDYRTLSAAKGDTKPVEAEIVFLAGWLGHYVGDGSMPLHTSNKPNGWMGANPKGYTTDHKIHGLFESVFVGANVKGSDFQAMVEAAKPRVVDDVWTEYVGYLRQSHTFVEQTYALEKAGAFTDAGTPEGKVFAQERLAAGTIELRDLIYTAWVKSADPVPEHKG